MNSPNTPRSRAVRVFLSSTFKDMHLERNHLASITFPALRQWCMKHRIFFNEVDLRWGVPQDGRPSLDICLREVDDCRPFFVGLIGHLSGNPVRAIDPSLKELYPWIEAEGLLGRSYTELEMQYAVLREQAAPSRVRSLFYFRRDSFSRRVAEINHLSEENPATQ